MLADQLPFGFCFFIKRFNCISYYHFCLRSHQKAVFADEIYFHTSRQPVSTRQASLHSIDARDESYLSSVRPGNTRGVSQFYQTERGDSGPETKWTKTSLLSCCKAAKCVSLGLFYCRARSHGLFRVRNEDTS